MAKGQAERLLGLAEALLHDEGFGWSDLDALAVAVGPGNFTGIRIAVSAVRGLALALQIPVISISNFEVRRGANSVSDRQPQLVRLPAPRSATYVQVFKDGLATGAPQLVADQSTELTELPLPHGTEVLGDTVELTDIPQTLIRIAAAKWHAGQVNANRPVPMYIKPPDAAPARDVAPRIVG